MSTLGSPSAPGATAPPRRSVAGTLALAVLLLLALSGVGFVITIIVLAVTGNQSAETSAERSREPGVVPPPLPVADDHSVIDAVRGGTCRRNDVERRKTSYSIAMRERGAASVLRGRVAIVHFKMSPPGTAWTPVGSRAVTSTAQATRVWLLDQAKRWRVDDLQIDAIEWPLTTTATIPSIRLDANKKPSATDGQVFRTTVRGAIEAAVGRTLSEVVADVEARHYDNVGFLVSFPSGPRGIRDFAAPTGAKGNAAELAYVLEPDWNATSRSMLAAHEILHLFGPDDLYEVRGVPRDETNDVMNAECDGLGPAVIGETTAYAIGWTTTPPPRSFSWSNEPRR